jgi:hypothetical protein
VSAAGGAVAGGIGGSFTRNTNFMGWSQTAMPVTAYNNIVSSELAANAGVSNFGRGLAGGIEGNYDYMSLISRVSRDQCTPIPPPPPCH